MIPGAVTDSGKVNNLLSCLAHKSPPGVVVEIGVYQGGCLFRLACTFPGRQFFGYDTFEGLPQHCHYDNYHKKGDFSDTSLEQVQQTFSLLKNVTLVKGIYPQSAKDCDPTPIALAHVDVDLYDSTLNSLEFLHPRMAPGGHIFCDDAFFGNTDGATLAFCEFAAKYKKIIRIVGDTLHAFIEY